MVEIPHNKTMKKKKKQKKNVMHVTKVSDKVRTLTGTWTLSIQRSSALTLNALKQVSNSVTCKRCDKDFTNFALGRHKDVCKGKQEFD